MATKKTDPMKEVLKNIERAMIEANKGNKHGAKMKRMGFSRFKDIERNNDDTLSFGYKEVDLASYCNGVPRGKIVELFGPESSGKSLLTLYLIGSCQRQGLECALVDAEMSFDPSWAGKHGVDADNLIYNNDFDSGEECLEYTYQLCKSGAFALVVLDSVAALTPKGELDGSLEKEARIGAQAQMLSRGVRKIMKVCGETGTTCVFINQTRTNVGVMYGNPEVTPGGKALKFYSHQRLRVAKKSQIKVGDEVIGQLSSVTFVKNKTARPFGSCEIKIIFDETALNPVVMLCNFLRDAKVLKPYKGIFRISKDIIGNKKFISTEETEIKYVADFLIKKNLVLKLIEYAIAYADDNNLILDGAILEMIEDHSKITSPNDPQISFDSFKEAPDTVEDDDSDNEDDDEDEEDAEEEDDSIDFLEKDESDF